MKRSVWVGPAVDERGTSLDDDVERVPDKNACRSKGGTTAEDRGP